MADSSLVKRKVILDTDPGVDDLQAIIMLLTDPTVEVLAFTTVAGNACYQQVMINIHKFLQYTGNTSIPVYQGSKASSFGNCPKSDGFFGQDGYANNPHPIDMNYPKHNMSSSEALNFYTKKYPGEVDLIAVGPLTNLAAAYLADNNFPKRLKSLYLMLSDDSETTKFNVSPFAEFNCWCDPVAFRVICNNFFTDGSKKIKLVDFNLCQRNLMTFEQFDQYYSRDGKQVERNIMGKFISYAYDSMKSKHYADGAVICDPIATFLYLYPESEHSSKVVRLANICLDGEKFAHTEYVDDPNGNIELFKTIDKELFYKILIQSVFKTL